MGNQRDTTDSIDVFWKVFFFASLDLETSMFLKQLYMALGVTRVRV